MSFRLTEELDPNTALSPQVYQLLKLAIVRSDVKPGERLSDVELAKGLEISRQPIRDAFSRLQNEDLLVVWPQRGTFVKRISVQAVIDARFVREAIEADIVRLLANEPEPALVTELKSLVAAQRKVIRKPPQSFMKLDDQFHRTLAEGAGKANAWNVIDGVKTQMDRVRYLSFNHFHVERLIREHSDIVTSISEGKVAASVKQMRRHLRGILDSIHHIAIEFPDFFTQVDTQFPDQSKPQDPSQKTPTTKPKRTKKS